MGDDQAPLQAKKFKDLVRFHISRGTRPPGVGQKRWRQNELAFTLSYAQPKTIKTWLSGANMPPSVTPLEFQFFGDKPEHDDAEYTLWRHQLRDAFAEAKRKKTQEVASENEPHKPNNVPLISIGHLFKGRNGLLKTLHEDLSNSAGRTTKYRLIYGLGGVGKTRLAIEYAWHYETHFSAIFFVACENSQRLTEGFAALATAGVIDLKLGPEVGEDTKIFAVQNWLRRNPGWLIVFDNVDDVSAKRSVVDLLPRLQGGSVIITSRLRHFPAAIGAFELNVLRESAAAEYLLKSTDGHRIAISGDEHRARELAKELDGLALGLEQAAAYISTKIISIERYLFLWRQKRKVVAKWFDKDLVGYNRDVGLETTWATSLESLSANGRLLIERLAFLSPEPIPDELLDAIITMDTTDYDPSDGRADLYSYSLASPALIATKTDGFVVHRLVQDFVRRSMPRDRYAHALQEAQAWIEVACTDKAQNAWEWPDDDALKPHAASIAEKFIAFVVESQARTLDHLQAVADCYRHLSLDRAIAAMTDATLKCQGTSSNDLLEGRVLSTLAELVARHKGDRAEAQTLLLRAAEIFAIRGAVDDFESALVAMRAHNIGPDGTRYEKRYAKLLEASNRFELKRLSIYLKFKLARFADETASFLKKLDQAVVAAKEASLQADFAGEIYESFPCRQSWDFEPVWQAVCGYISTLPEIRGANASLFCDALRFSPQLFIVSFARNAIELLNEGSIDMDLPIVGKKKIRATLEACRVRLDIIEMLTKKQAVNWGKMTDRLLTIPRKVGLHFSEILGTEEEEAHDADVWFWDEGLRFIGDLIPVKALQHLCRNMLGADSSQSWHQKWLARRALPILAQRLYDAGELKEGAQIAQHALRLVWNVAVSRRHAALLKLEALLSDSGVDLDDLREKSVSVSFLDKSIDATTHSDLAVSLVASARGRCCLLVEGKFEQDPQWVSFNGPYLTIHFTDQSYYIVDNDLPDFVEKIERTAENFFLIRTFNGEPIEGYQTKPLINAWPTY